MKITPIKVLGILIFSSLLTSATCDSKQDECDECISMQRAYYKVIVENSGNQLYTSTARNKVINACENGEEKADYIRSSYLNDTETIYSCDKIEDNAVAECYKAENIIDPPVDKVIDGFLISVLRDYDPAMFVTIKKVEMFWEDCHGVTTRFYENSSPNNLTDEMGDWRVEDVHFDFTFKNKKDKIVVKVIINDGTTDWSREHIIYWEHCQSSQGTCEDVYSFGIPL